MGWAAEWIAKFLAIFYRLSRNFLKHELPLFPLAEISDLFQVEPCKERRSELVMAI